MKNDKKKAGNRGHDKSPRGVKDGLGSAEAKLYYNKKTGATNFRHGQRDRFLRSRPSWEHTWRIPL